MIFLRLDAVEYTVTVCLYINSTKAVEVHKNMSCGSTVYKEVSACDKIPYSDLTASC